MSEDVFRKLLALVLPRPDAPAGLLGLDRPPEPACSRRVAALGGDTCEVGKGAHGRMAVLRLPGEIEDRAIRDATGRHRFDGLTEVVPFARLSITL